MDAIETYVHANERRHGGTGVRLGYMLASEDTVALDYVGLELLKGIDTSLACVRPQDVAYIAHAFELGLGSIEYKIELISESSPCPNAFCKLFLFISLLAWVWWLERI